MTRDDVIGNTIGCAVALVLAVGLLFLAGVFVEAAFDHDQTAIESLRADAANVSADVGEDVIGQVTQWNQTIESNRYMNSLPIIGFIYSDRWATVERIEVPR